MVIFVSIWWYWPIWRRISQCHRPRCATCSSRPKEMPYSHSEWYEEGTWRNGQFGSDSTGDWAQWLGFKSNWRWCICLDPKDLHRAVKRSHYHTPTLEEITHKFKGSTVFSKLDARHGYWSVVLDEESSYLTTFNSPFGRFRFTRLPFGLCVSQDVFQLKTLFLRNALEQLVLQMTLQYMALLKKSMMKICTT